MSYAHAPDDAPLYRVPKALGGRVFPAYRAWDDMVALDVDGDLITFDADKVTLIVRPEGMPDWATAIVQKVLAYEEEHSKADGAGLCFAALVEAIPAEAREYLEAQRAAGGAS